MFEGRSIEFLEGDNGRLSMTRLLCFVSIFPASWVVVQTNNSDTLGWYLGAYVIGYVGGKATDVFMKDKPQTSVTETTTRTVTPSVLTEDVVAKDVTVKAEGDVNVTKTKRRKNV